MLLFPLLPTTLCSSTSLHPNLFNHRNAFRPFGDPCVQTTQGILGSSPSAHLNPFSHRNVFRLLEGPCSPTTRGVLGSSTSIHHNIFNIRHLSLPWRSPCIQSPLAFFEGNPASRAIHSSTSGMSSVFMKKSLAHH